MRNHPTFLQRYRWHNSEHRYYRYWIDGLPISSVYPLPQPRHHTYCHHYSRKHGRQHPNNYRFSGQKSIGCSTSNCKHETGNWTSAKWGLPSYFRKRRSTSYTKISATPLNCSFGFINSPQNHSFLSFLKQKSVFMQNGLVFLSQKSVCKQTVLMFCIRASVRRQNVNLFRIR